MAISTIDTSSISALGYGFKNRLINGNMAISQRGTSFTLTSGATAYTLDRWYVNTTGGAGVVTQNGSVGAYNLRVTGASGISSGFFGQKIESNNIADLAGQTVTYSIRASSSVLTSLTWYARFPTAQDNYAGVTAISNGTINITSTPTTYSFQIALPAGAVNGLEIYFTFGAFTSGTLDITSAQLEAGVKATSFDYRPYGTELDLCLRYFQQYGGTSTYEYIGQAIAASTTQVYASVDLMCPMRIAPSVAFTGVVGNFTLDGGNNNYPITSNIVINSGTSTQKARLTVTYSAGTVTTSASYTFLTYSTSTGKIQFSAEL